MDYQKIYNQLVARGQSRSIEGYTEKHHILPRCLGGTDKKENLVRLTGREHFIAHWLLCRIHSNEPKLANAFWLMSTFKSSWSNQRTYKVSSRAYQEAKIIKAAANTLTKKGVSNKIDPALKKQQCSKGWETRRAKGEFKTNKGMKFPGKVCGVSKGNIPHNKGKKMKSLSQEQKDHLSSINKLKSKGEVIAYKEGIFVGSFINTTIAAEQLNLKNGTNICSVIAGRLKRYGGYTFERRSINA